MAVTKNEIPMRDVDYQVDTIGDKNTGALGYMTSNKNSITINHRLGDNEWNEKSESDCTIIHEQKHRDNHQQGMFAYAVSREQAYRLAMHDEISANIAELLLLRKKYIETGDISIFEKEKGGKFAFYGEAIKNGEINPKSKYQEDFNNEMHFIVMKTQNMWLERFASSDTYVNECMHSVKTNYNEKYARYFDENYQRGVDIAYNIGGVNFANYMDADVEIPYVGQKKLDLTEAETLSNEEVAAKFNIPAYDGTMSLGQYQSLVQHKLLLDRSIDEKYIDSREHYEDLKNNADLSGMYDAIDQHLIDIAVNSAARDYRDQDVSVSNDDAYNKALNELYMFEADKNIYPDGAVCMRNALVSDDLEKKIESRKLPDEAKKIYNRSSPEIIGEEIKSWGKSLFDSVSSGINKVKNWFIPEQYQEVKNEIINPINDKDPSYRKWQDKDGSRVSEIQKRRLPDMTKNVIQRPTASKKDNDIENFKKNIGAGHDRVVAMRQKLTTGHDSYLKKQNPLESIYNLRFERARPISYGNKHPITAEMLQQQLKLANGGR